MPMGQIPVLEIDGNQLHQSVAICHYLGKKFDLVGNDDSENYEIDSIVDTINDFKQSKSSNLKFLILNCKQSLSTEIANVHYENDSSLQASKRKQLNEETIAFYMKKLEEIANVNNGHLALKRATWADFVRN